MNTSPIDEQKYPPLTRIERRENAIIKSFLNNLTISFIDFVALQSEEEKEGEKVTEKFVEYNLKWRKFCNRKWKKHRLDLTSFERSVDLNVKHQVKSIEEEKISDKEIIVKQ